MDDDLDDLDDLGSDPLDAEEERLASDADDWLDERAERALEERRDAAWNGSW